MDNDLWTINVFDSAGNAHVFKSDAESIVMIHMRSEDWLTVIRRARAGDVTCTVGFFYRPIAAWIS